VCYYSRGGRGEKKNQRLAQSVIRIDYEQNCGENPLAGNPKVPMEKLLFYEFLFPIESRLSKKT